MSKQEEDNMAEPVCVELLRSQYDGKTIAVSVAGIRHGADAGPWTVVQRWQLDDRLVCYEPELHEAHETGMRPTGEMAQGEIELTLHVDGHDGSSYMSREFWEALGVMAGWRQAG
jgi:hypothetical protein